MTRTLAAIAPAHAEPGAGMRPTLGPRLRGNDFGSLRRLGHLARPTAFIVLPIDVSALAMNAANSGPGAHAVP